MSEAEIRDLFGKLMAEYEKNLTDKIAAALAEHEKQRLENAWTNKVKTFIVKHFSTLVICVLLFWCFGGGTAVKNYASGWFARIFNVQINNALIQRIIPDKTDRKGFIERIQKLFEQEYASSEHFESHYNQLTADYQRKYPALKEIKIRTKEELAKFAELQLVHGSPQVFNASYVLPVPKETLLQEQPDKGENDGNNIKSGVDDAGHNAADDNLIPDSVHTEGIYKDVERPVSEPVCKNGSCSVQTKPYIMRRR